MKMSLIFIATLVGCTGSVTQHPNPADSGASKEAIDLNDHREESEPCSKTEKVSFRHDGGSFSVETPLPCNPRYDSSRDWGDPVPYRGINE